MKTSSPPRPDLPIMMFEDPAAWTAWLAANYASSSGVWLRHAKKASNIPSVTYHEALDVALCYGWIDGQKKSYDETTWLQKWTPRGKKSIWSKINREKVKALIEQGQMQPAGLGEVERAKADGRWDAAYDSQSTATMPDDFGAALDASPPAKPFSPRLIALTDTRSCSASKQPRKPRRAHGVSRSSSACWSGRKSCIHRSPLSSRGSI